MAEKNNNYILIGMPGSGKSTIGVLLAKALGYDFVDTDLVIQQKGGGLLKEIIARIGNDGFKQLEEDGVLSLNKELELPIPTNKIAIISSPTAAGYEDFLDQLANNPYGFIFYTKLFPALMQGERTESSIISALPGVR